MAISGDTAVIGATRSWHPRVLSPPSFRSGLAYVFQRNETTWTQQEKLTPSDGAKSDWFGHAVAVSEDTAVIGAPFHDDEGPSSSAAYVFHRRGTRWAQQAKLTASDAAAEDRFGDAVAVSGDTTVVGAWGDADATGAAYVFQRNGTTWSQQAKLTAIDAAAADQFGGSVAISGDTAVVGAFRHDDPHPDSGTAYVFQRSGTTWTQQAKLTASEETLRGWSFRGLSRTIQKPDRVVGGLAVGDGFGSSVAISGDTVVVGAFRPGSAYVFQRNGTTWTQQALLKEDVGVFGPSGVSVSVSGDAAVIGTYQAASRHTGAAYLYQRNGTTWSQQAKLIGSDVAEGDEFGFSVAISGGTAMVGAQADDDAGSQSGSVYVFDRGGRPGSR